MLNETNPVKKVVLFFSYKFILCSAVLSSLFLGEYLNKLRKAGILLSLVGSTMIIIHAPRQERVSTFAELVTRFMDKCEFKHNLFSFYSCKKFSK